MSILSSLISISISSPSKNSTVSSNNNYYSAVSMEGITIASSHIKTISYTSPKSSNTRAYSPTGYGYSYSYSYGYSSCGYNF
ncbi:hypothetical protein DDB_G0268454 [Dictyostelium discoideum AX4]|uniref:HssA/B-like protein 5 n=1 Tax=Dictyostelium discoideum TaxID=44689 RepID=HSL5_DICDI|nr:hypothetical protein DDB_G0268454 [Dictyostelium discoideum AX4]Q55FC6.1 RecName: Full=HssA/B-like protein 5 [Dictyostelium discoideum]EAL73680.1 hypothetical protein DDB_G0268454 [Dictyostelium discoideum AX4]|eukprot:XP_647607.1 hypothetical protein DDB_G0268454 [Dictyostelium discoideum AX4]